MSVYINTLLDVVKGKISCWNCLLHLVFVMAVRYTHPCYENA